MLRIEPEKKCIYKSFRIISSNKVAREIKDFYNNIFKTKFYSKEIEEDRGYIKDLLHGQLAEPVLRKHSAISIQSQPKFQISL